MSLEGADEHAQLRMHRDQMLLVTPDGHLPSLGDVVVSIHIKTGATKRSKFVFRTDAPIFTPTNNTDVTDSRTGSSTDAAVEAPSSG